MASSPRARGGLFDHQTSSPEAFIGTPSPWPNRVLSKDSHLDRCYLKGQAGDAANAVLSAVGYNFRRILAWLSSLLRLILAHLIASFVINPALNRAS